MQKSKISIIGLGWLGLPLYNHLDQLGFLCKGSTTSEEKKQNLLSKGISVFKLQINETKIEGDIKDCLEESKILIINTPPGLRRNPDSNYVAKIEQLLQHIEKSDIDKVLYISSTSVFKDEKSFPLITNDSEPNSNTNAGAQIRKVEKLLFDNVNFQTTILRFSGLVDERRHPATMMSKRTSVNNADAPVNLIHREDCIRIITKIIEQNHWGKVLNASCPIQKTKKEYYNSVCDTLGLKHPNFDLTVQSKGKKIDGSKTSDLLKYTYNYVV